MAAAIKQIGIVQEVRGGAAFDESSQHDGRGFRLLGVDQPFGLIEGGLAGAGRRFGLTGTGRRQSGWEPGAASANVTRPARQRHRRATRTRGAAGRGMLIEKPLTPGHGGQLVAAIEATIGNRCRGVKVSRSDALCSDRGLAIVASASWLPSGAGIVDDEP